MVRSQDSQKTKWYKSWWFFSLLAIIVIGIILFFVYSSSLINNPYGWKSVIEPTDSQFKQILSYKFTNGLEEQSWIEEANGGWRVTNGSKVIYERWLKTTYGYPSDPNDKPVFKVYLEGISQDTFENYVKDVEKAISGKNYYNNAWYSLSWNENTQTQTYGDSYIIFPDKKLGAYLMFYKYQQPSKQEAEEIIKELIDHVQSLK